MTLEEKAKLCADVTKGAPAVLAQLIMDIPVLKRCVQVLLLENMDSQCKKLCVTPSVLRTSREDQKNLTSFTWMEILHEMKDRAPDVLDFLVTIAVPKLNDDGKQVLPLCDAYGILMNLRCRELSLVQRINTVVLETGSATKKVINDLFIGEIVNL